MPVDRALPAAHDPRSRFSLMVAIVGLAGVASIFLPFTYAVSPLDAAGTLPFLRGDEHFLGGLWRLGVPLFLAILVTVGTFRRVVSGRLTRAERMVGYLAALVAAACLLSIFFTYGADDAQSSPSGIIEWFMVAFPLVGLAAGVYLLRRNSRTGVPDAASTIAAMQIVYVIVAIICLATYASPELQIGAYLVAVTTLVYLVQIVAVAVAAPGQTALAPK
jgi:hypothetical protein